MKRVLLSIAMLGILTLSGCSNTSSLRQNSVVQNTARGFLTGQYYDRAAIAVRNNDELSLQFSQTQLQLIAPRMATLPVVQRVAEQMVREAADLDILAQQEKDDNRARKLRAQAAQKYRAALKISSNFDSKNPELLNALGYFLAEWGTTIEDFKMSERLTRRSLDIWNRLLEDAENSLVPKIGNPLSLLRMARANTRDSLAWALFQQGNYREALNEQVLAVQEAEKSAPVINKPMPADLYYHLGEIYRVLSNDKEARLQYEKALSVQPDHTLSQRALMIMESKKLSHESSR